MSNENKGNIEGVTTVTIEEGSVVTGNISGNQIYIHGAVKGNISAEDSISLTAIGAVLLLISTFSDTKKKMLGIQIFDAASNTIADALLGGWSGVMLNIIGIVRNITTIKGDGKTNKALLSVLVLFTIVVTVMLNPSGFLPLIAELEYTIVVSRCDLFKSKIALSLNLFLWLFYDILLQSYPVAIADLIILISSLFAIAKTSDSRNQNQRFASVNLDGLVKADESLRKDESNVGSQE